MNVVIGIKIKKAGIFIKPILKGNLAFNIVPEYQKPIAPNKDNGVLLLDNILPQQLYLDLSSSFNQAFGKKAKADHLCKRGASRSVGMKYRRLKKIRKFHLLEN